MRIHFANLLLNKALRKCHRFRHNGFFFILGKPSKRLTRAVSISKNN